MKPPKAPRAQYDWLVAITWTAVGAIGVAVTLGLLSVLLWLGQRLALLAWPTVRDNPAILIVAILAGIVALGRMGRR